MKKVQVKEMRGRKSQEISERKPLIFEHSKKKKKKTMKRRVWDLEELPWTSPPSNMQEIYFLIKKIQEKTLKVKSHAKWF